MLILKFSLALFLAALAAAVVARVNRAEPVGGPFFYADRPGLNPVRPSGRLGAFRAVRSRRHIRAYFDRRSQLVLEQHMEGRQEAYRVEYLHTKEGRLRRRRTLAAGLVVDEFVAP